MAVPGTFHISIRKKVNLKEDEMRVYSSGLGIILPDFSGTKILRQHEKHPHLTR